MKLIGYTSDYAYGDLQRSIYGLTRGKRHRNIKLSLKPKSGICCYCETELNKLNYTRDHLYPKSLGGRLTKPCCRDCNTEKANLTLVQYMQKVGNQLRILDKKGLRETGEFQTGKTKIRNIELLMELRPDET